MRHTISRWVRSTGSVAFRYRASNREDSELPESIFSFISGSIQPDSVLLPRRGEGERRRPVARRPKGTLLGNGQPPRGAAGRGLRPKDEDRAVLQGYQEFAEHREGDEQGEGATRNYAGVGAFGLCSGVDDRRGGAG